MADSDTPPLTRARRRQLWWIIACAVAFLAYVPLHAVNFFFDGPIGGLALFAAVRAFWLDGWIKGAREVSADDR